jgi:Hint domain-containing protein
MVDYAYSQTILGTQSTANGAPVNYNFAPPAGAAWSYSGSVFTHVVNEADPNAVNYNGDVTNEQVNANMGVGGTGEQSTLINGTPRAVVYDYTFSVSDGTTTYQIAVIDVDLNNDGDLNDAGEDGYYLLFVGAVPPPNTNLTIGGITDNSTSQPHSSMGGVVVCFTSGTLISTPLGGRLIEDLKVGDLVLTADNGLQAIRWIGSMRISGARLYASPEIRPVCIRKHAFGHNLPERDTWVSPQHRMLVGSKETVLNYNEPEVFVPAKGLVNGGSVIVDQAVTQTTYIHMLFDQHEVVFANGIPSESFHPGIVGFDALDQASRREIYEIFPELRYTPTLYGPSARVSLGVKEVSGLSLVA